MSAHVFSEIFLHINWHTKNDLPVLKAEVEQYVHQYLRNRCRQTSGVFFEEVGGTDDHVHLVFRIEPTINIDKFIGEVKGASSFETNKQHKRKTLEWQIGYWGRELREEATAMGAEVCQEPARASRGGNHVCQA